MARTFVWRSVLLAALAWIAGCAEQLTTPGTCPALCPPHQVQLADTLLPAADSADTSSRGYVLMGEAAFLAASTLDSLKSVMLVRLSAMKNYFRPNSDTLDTVPAVFPPDSIICTVTLAWRDTTVHPSLVLYRVPAGFDTAVTYAQAMASFTDSTLLDTVPIPDTVTSAYRFKLPTGFFPAFHATRDSVAVAFGAKVIADGPTVIAIQSGHAGTSGPTLSYFLHGQPPQDTLTTTSNIVIDSSGTFFVQAPAPGRAPPGVLAVGGMPSAHAIVHLALPKVVVDSVAVVRATLLLNLARPVVAFPHDSFTIEARALLRDFGPKSVIYPDTAIVGRAKVLAGQTGVVELDIAPMLRLWGTTAGDSLPRAIEVSVVGEGSIFAEVDIAGRSGGIGGPQLRVTYVKKYEFGVP